MRPICWNAKQQWQIHPIVEVRLKIRARKYRVPDVMVLAAAASYPAVIEQPPLLCIEIVSPDDKLPDLVIRAGDYLSMGVPITWILDPETKQVFIYSDEGTIESREPVLRHNRIETADCRIVRTPLETAPPSYVSKSVA